MSQSLELGEYGILQGKRDFASAIKGPGLPRGGGGADGITESLGRKAEKKVWVRQV